MFVICDDIDKSLEVLNIFLKKVSARNANSWNTTTLTFMKSITNSIHKLFNSEPKYWIKK